jgi:hypothetical protein
MYPEIYNPPKAKHAQRVKWMRLEETFQCRQCGAVVHTHPTLSGVQNRNHCPYCLCSLHVDHIQAGDRLSACKGIMQPIGLTAKPSRNKYAGSGIGELMLIHHCRLCGKLSINRLAADDLVDRLMDVFQASVNIEINLLERVIENRIMLLAKEDLRVVERQLMGRISE